MKGKRFTEEQIIRILHEAESGLAVAEQTLDIRMLKDVNSKKW